MLVFVHIFLAFLSVIYATFAVFIPSQKKLNSIYLLTVFTIISGIALFFERQISITHTCVSGLLYLGFVVTTATIVKWKLTSISE